MTSCATTPTTVTDVSCSAFNYISYSLDMDTEETVLEIVEHNAVYKEICS